MSIYSAKDIGLDLPVAAQGNEAGQGLYGANDIGLAHLDGPAPSTSKRGFGSSLVKSAARVGESVANLIEGDPLKVNRADIGLFSSGETGWQMDDMGNLTGFDTRPAEEIRKDDYGLVARAAGAVRKSLHDVKGGEYEKGSAAEVVGAVIENAPHSLIYMLPHFMPGGGNISNAIMYQDTYLSRLKELRDLRAQGKIEATDQDIENNASKYGFAEMMPEAVGNASEAAIIKGVSRIVPGLSAFPKAMEVISKIRGPKTGSALIAELFPSTARKAGRVVTAGVASAPVEGLTEYITETGLGSMEGQAPLDLSIGSATIPAGMSREDYMADRGKFAATVGALSGAAISGTMSAVSQVNQSNSRDAFVSDIVSPIDAVNPESGETKVAAGKRFSAISDLITIIGQSGISEEEKTNAAVNLLQAFDRNEKVDLQNIFVEPSDLAGVEDVGETSMDEELSTGESAIEAETQAKVDRAVEGLKAINIEEESAIQEPIELTEQDIIKEPQRDYKAEFDAFSQRELTDTQVITSTRVDSGFAKILKGVHDRIGTKANIALFSTIDFAGEEGSAFREYLETQGHSVLDIRGGRVFQSERDGKKFYTIVANTDTMLPARSAIIMHEALGHITMMEHFDLAPAELQRALLKEFAQWKKFDRTPEGFLSFDSFNEDFGDPKTLLWSSLIGRPGESRQQVNRRSFHEFMAHRLSSKMQQRPEVQGIIQRYWASLKAKINKMYEAFKAQFLDIATNVNSIDEFIDFLFKAGNYAEVRQDNVENLNSILEEPAQVDKKTRLIQAVFDSMFEVVGGKRVLKSSWRFKKVFKDGNRSLVSRKDIESSGIYYKEEKGKTVVYKNKDVLFTIPWDASRNLSAQSARMIATNLRDLYILATLQPSHVERAKANSTKMLNTSTGKKVTVKMGNRAARTLEIMWERAATLAQEQGISERQAFLMIMSGEGSAFSSLRPGVAGTEATGSLRKNMDRWIAMHESDLSSMLQETPTAEPVQVEQELVKEHIEEPKQTALSVEVTQTIDQVRGIIETWWNKPKPSERVQDFEGLTQKVIFYFDLNGKDYTEVKPEIRNLIGATIKDVLQEKTGVEVQGEVKNKVVQRDKVLQMHKTGMNTTLAEAELQSFDINISEEDLKQWAGTDNFVDARSTRVLMEPSPDEMMDIMTIARKQSEQLADEHVQEGRFWEDVHYAMPVKAWTYFDSMLKQEPEWQNIYSRLCNPNLDWRDALAEFEAIANRYANMPLHTKIDIQKPNGEYISAKSTGIAIALSEFIDNLREWHTNESDRLYSRIKDDLVTAASSVKPRYRYSKQDHAYIDQTTGEVIAFDRFNPGSMTEGFETGKPVAITNLFHGTTDDIHAFRSKHLGSLTGAQSAKMGFFMAADPTVAGSYPMIMGKPRPLNRSAKIMDNYGRKVFVEIRDLIRSVLEPKRGDISWKDSKIVYGNIDVNTAKVLANDGYADIGYMALKDSAGRLIDRIGLGLVYDTNGNLGIDVDAPWELDQALDGLPTGEIEQGKYFKKLEKKLGEFWNQATFGENYIDWGDPAIMFQGEPVPAGANVIKTVGKMQNPFVKDWKGGSYRDGGWSDGIREAKEKGHDGVIYLNARDGVGYGHRIVTNIFVFFNGHQIKSDFATVGAFRSKSGKLVEKEKMPESFDLFGNYDRVTKILGEDLTLGSYTDSIDGFKKAYFSDRGISFVPLASGEKSPPGNGFIRPSWKRNSDAGKLTLWHVIEHEDLFAVYPELNNLKVKFFDGMGRSAGSADWSNWTINVDYSQDTDTVRSIILHELQHIIQAQESWAGGQSMRGAKAFKDHLRLQRDRLGRDISTFIAINKMIKAGKSYQEAMSDYMQANRFNGIKLQSANYIATLAADMGWEKLSEELQQARVDAAKATIFDTGSAFEAYRHAAGEEEARRAEALFYLTDDEVRVAFRDRGIAAGSDISDRSLLYKTDARTLQVVLSATSTVEDTAQDELTYASYAMLDSFDLNVIPFAKPTSKKTTQDYITQLSKASGQSWTSGKLFHFVEKFPAKLKDLGLTEQDISKIKQLRADQSLLLDSFAVMRGLDLEYNPAVTSIEMYNKPVQDLLANRNLRDWFSTYQDFLHNPNIWDASRDRYSTFSQASNSSQAYAVVALALGATSEAIRASESTNLRATHQGRRAITSIIDPITDAIIVPAGAIITASAMDRILDIGIEKINSKPALSLASFDLKISPKRRGQRKETTTGPYAGIIKQARKASKPRKPSVVDPLKMEKKRAALFSFLEKMDVIRERGEQLGLSTSEVMLKLGFAPDQVRKHIARYNRHKSKFSQNETIIRLAEIAGLINEETGRENLESLIKTMFPPTEFEEVQPDGTVKKVTDPGSDGSLQSLSTIGKDMLINKLQTIIASSTGSKFDIENERSLGESIEEYKQEWASTGRLKKLGGFLKYVQSSAADFLESTKSGNELSFKLRRYLLTKTVMQRNYLVELNDFARKYSSVEERQKFYEVISGEREAATGDEKKFANLVKSINRSYGAEMQTLQVRVYKKDGSFTFFRYDQDMSDSYFPHMWKAEWFRNPTQDMIQSLLDSGEAQDRAHAKRIIQDFHKQTIRARKFANVEMARETELGGWITDPIEVYQKYVLGASARLASLREFGSTPEVVLAQLAIRHLKESRDPEALSKARDLINRVLGTKIEDQLLKEPKAAMSFGVMYSVGLLLQHSMLVQPGVMANMGALGGYKNLVKGISAVLPALWGNNKGQMNKRWAELAGVLAFTVNRELNDIVMDDETRLKSDKILRSFGITQVDASMRIVGAIVGKLYATDVAMKYAEMGDAKSAQRLRRLGIDPRKITRDYLQSQEWYTKDLRMAALAFTEDTNFVLDPMRMPSIIQGHPLARILFLFKNFAFQQHRFLLRLLREDKGKAFKSLVGSLSGGALIMLVRMLLQGDDPEKILEKDGIAKTVWRAFMAGGGAGLFAEAIGSAVIPGSGPQTGMALDSPVFGLIETLGRGGKSLYNFAEGDATDQDMHNLYRSAIMALQGGALAMPTPVGVPLNAAIGFTRPLAERAIAPSDRQRETSYLQ